MKQNMLTSNTDSTDVISISKKVIYKIIVEEINQNKNLFDEKKYRSILNEECIIIDFKPKSINITIIISNDCFIGKENGIKKLEESIKTSLKMLLSLKLIKLNIIVVTK